CSRTRRSTGSTCRSTAAGCVCDECPSTRSARTASGLADSAPPILGRRCRFRTVTIAELLDRTSPAPPASRARRAPSASPTGRRPLTRWCGGLRRRGPPHLPLCLGRSDALAPNGECRADDECCAGETADGGGRAGVDRRELEAGPRVRRLRGRLALEERLVDTNSLTQIRNRPRIPRLRRRLALEERLVDTNSLTQIRNRPRIPRLRRRLALEERLVDTNSLTQIRNRPRI